MSPADYFLVLHFNNKFMDGNQGVSVCEILPLVCIVLVVISTCSSSAATLQQKDPLRDRAKQSAALCLMSPRQCYQKPSSFILGHWNTLCWSSLCQGCREPLCQSQWFCPSSPIKLTSAPNTFSSWDPTDTPEQQMDFPLHRLMDLKHAVHQYPLELYTSVVLMCQAIKSTQFNKLCYPCLPCGWRQWPSHLHPLSSGY